MKKSIGAIVLITLGIIFLANNLSEHPYWGFSQDLVAGHTYRGRFFAIDQTSFLKIEMKMEFSADS